MLLSVGALVDRYVILGPIGSGGQAVVYGVRHERLGTIHALKVLSTPIGSARIRLEQEGRLQAKVKHRHVLLVTDLIDVAGNPGILMELVDGPSLDRLMEHLRPNQEQVDDLACGILEGVAEAHRHGLVHRDLKPHNVLLQPEGVHLVPKIADFGLAKLLGDNAGALTRTGQAMGTPGYMAPEQIRNTRGVDHRADLFSLGVVLYELLTGRRPYEDPDPITTWQKIVAGDHVPVRELAPDAPERMLTAIESAMVIDRDERVPTAEALLSVWLSGSERPRPVRWDPLVLAGLPRPSLTRFVEGGATQSISSIGSTISYAETAPPPVAAAPPQFSPTMAPVSADFQPDSLDLPVGVPPRSSSIAARVGAGATALIAAALLVVYFAFGGGVAVPPSGDIVGVAPESVPAPVRATGPAPAPAPIEVAVGAPTVAPASVPASPAASSTAPSRPLRSSPSVAPAPVPFRLWSRPVATARATVGAKPGTAVGRGWAFELSPGSHEVVLESTDGRSAKTRLSVEAGMDDFCWNYDTESACSR